MSITCPKCDNSIKLNGPLRKIHCNACQNNFEIPVKYWKENLSDALEWIVSDMKEGEGYNLKQFGQFETKWSVYELAPRCEDCEKEFSLKNIVVREESEITCPKCETKTNIVPAPKWMKNAVPAADYLVNIQTEDNLQDNEPAISGGIALNCPQCGGSLLIDGKDRLVPCKYCSVNIYLPDDLWLRLHPVKVKTRWFLVYNKEKVEKMDFD
ncbi:MAG: hypothetical protein ACTSQF_09330 [Candidatus Heimdallarchaeaceae archaeon]